MDTDAEALAFEDGTEPPTGAERVGETPVASGWRDGAGRRAQLPEVGARPEELLA